MMSPGGERPPPAGTTDALAWLGAGICVLWTAFAALSWRFDPDGDLLRRPILPALGLLGLMFLLYLAAARTLLNGERRRRGTAAAQVRVMWAVAVALRVVALFSLPFQEVDYFRYLWDGRQVLAGVSPYAFSPAQVDAVLEDAAGPPSAELERLAAVVEDSKAVRDIFEHVDHREVPSIYPPTSQAVFALAAVLTPRDAPRWAHLTLLRVIFVALDLLVIALLAGLLRRLAMNPALALIYAWSPLVLKEFANSAHMDVIAVALLMGALHLALPAPGRSRAGRAWAGYGSAVLWAAAILAKFFPVVLAPLLWTWWGRRFSAGRRMMATGVAIAVMAGGYALLPRAAPTSGSSPAHGSLSGLGAFAGRWEMNDLAFALIHENLRRPSESSDATEALGDPWFAVTPESFRRRLSQWAESGAARAGFRPAEGRVPFLMTQLIVGTIFASIALRLALGRWPERRRLGERELPRRIFATLAALWYLSATQNPWYWAWVLPFVPFARCARVWLWTGGLALLYYLRFWLRYHGHLLPSGWDGLRIFDEAVVWVEHLPVLLAAAWCGLRERKS